MEEKEESDSSETQMEPPDLSFLINPESKIQELRLYRCDLTFSCSHDLLSILITNKCLTRLDLSFINLQDSGMKLLCEGLRDLGCTLQELRVYDCKATLSCCDNLCSVITTNRTLTRLEITLDVDEKMVNSQVDHCCEVLLNV
ncbi:unnamed protein product, partial [Staurois parvus]